MHTELPDTIALRRYSISVSGEHILIAAEGDIGFVRVDDPAILRVLGAIHLNGKTASLLDSVPGLSPKIVREVIGQLLAVGLCVPATGPARSLQSRQVLLAIESTIHAIARDAIVLGDEDALMLEEVLRPARIALATLRARVTASHEASVSELTAGGRTKFNVLLGGGRDGIKGWTNCDVHSQDIKANLTQALPLADSSTRYVYASFVLEHLDYEEGQRLLSEVSRILTPGGALRVVVPDAHALLTRYVGGSPKFLAERWGNAQIPSTALTRTLRYLGARPGSPSQYDSHRSAYDFDTLAQMLLDAGFEAVTRSSHMGSLHSMLNLDSESEAFWGELEDKTLALYVDAIKPRRRERRSRPRRSTSPARPS